MNATRYREAEHRFWKSAGVAPTEQRVHLRHVDVTIRVQEVGRGPTVVFVHGATTSGASWAPLVARLEGFHCVLLDRPGCGLSDARDRRFDDLEELGTFADALIVDLLDAMGLDRAHVIATSFGGYVALRTAAAHPDRIDRLVLFGWPVGASRMPLSIRLGSVPQLGRLLAGMPLTARTVRAMLRRIGLRQALDAGRFSTEALEWYLSLLRDTDTMRNDLGMGPRFPLRRMDDRLLLSEDLLANVRVPTHLLWGEDDPFGDATVARRFVAYLPQADLELLPGAGHAPWIDDPDRAATTTRELLVDARRD